MPMYGGNAFGNLRSRIRAPLALPSGPVANVDLDARQGVAAFGGGGSTWTPTAGSPVFIPRDSVGPAFAANGISTGRPGLTFNTGTGLVATGGFTLNTAAFSIFLVTKMTNASTVQTLIGTAAFGGIDLRASMGNGILLLASGSTTQIDITSLWAINTPFLLSLVISGTTAILRINKIQKFNGAIANGFVSAAAQIGTTRNATTFDFIGGSLGAVKLYNSALIPSDVVLVENALAADWGL